MKSKNRSAMQINKLLPWLFLVFVYILLMVFYARYGRHYLNGDISTDMVMAKHLNDEGVLFSKNFWYTTELRFLNVVNVYQIGLMLFPGNWLAVRLFAIGVLLPATAFSFIYMARGAGLKESAVWGAAAIIMPTSVFYLLLMTYGLCYNCYVVAAFVQFGLCLRLAKGFEQGKARFFLRYGLLAVLGVLSGLQGLRLLMISAAPLGVTAFLLLCRRALKSSSIRETAFSWEGRFILAAAVNALFILAGAMVNALVFSKLYHYADQTTRILTRFTVRDLLAQVDAIFEQLGWAGPVQAVNIQGALSVLAIGLTFFLIVSAVMLAMRRKDAQPMPEQALFLLTVVALVLGIWINAMFRCEGSFSPSYFITGLLLLMASGFFLLEKLPVRMPWVKTLCMLALAGVFLLESIGTLKGGVIQKNITPREEAAHWLVDHGYTQGFATFWEANPITEASDGKLECWTLAELSRPEKLYEWGQSMHHAETRPQGKTFFYTVLSPEDYDMVVQWMGREPDWSADWQGHQPDWTLPEGLYRHMIYVAEDEEALFAPVKAANVYPEE